MFSKVSYKELGNIPAQVNRVTGELFINPLIWKNMPTDYKEYILLHEQGHLELMSADEYQVNRHAIGKYLKAGELTDEEFGRRLVVLSEVLSDKHLNPDISNAMGGIDPVSAVANAVGSIFENLPLLGVGNKSRRREQDNAAENAMRISEAKSSATQRIILIGGAFVLVILIVVFLLKK